MLNKMHSMVKYINGKSYLPCMKCNARLVPVTRKRIAVCDECSKPQEEPTEEPPQSRMANAIEVMNNYSELNAQFLKDVEEKRKFKNRLIGRKRYKFYNEGNFTENDWLTCLHFFDYECAYCGAKESNTSIRSKHAKRKDWITQEHIISLEAGGKHEKGNVVPACFSCNAKKQHFDFEFWYQQQDFYSEDRLKKIKRYLASAL